MFKLLGLLNVARIYPQLVDIGKNASITEAKKLSDNPAFIASKIPPTKEQKIIPDRLNLKYSGRVNWEAPQASAFSYPGTAIEFNFTGTSLKVELSEHNLLTCDRILNLKLRCYNYPVDVIVNRQKDYLP